MKIEIAVHQVCTRCALGCAPGVHQVCSATLPNCQPFSNKSQHKIKLLLTAESLVILQNLKYVEIFFLNSLVDNMDL